MIAPTADEPPTFDRFDHDDAFRVGTRLAVRCREQKLPVTISIHLGLQRVFHAALPGTSADNDSWVDRKIRIAQYFADSSLAVYHLYAKDGWEQFFFAFGLSTVSGDMPGSVRLVRSRTFTGSEAAPTRHSAYSLGRHRRPACSLAGPRGRTSRAMY